MSYTGNPYIKTVGKTLSATIDFPLKFIQQTWFSLSTPTSCGKYKHRKDSLQS